MKPDRIPKFFADLYRDLSDRRLLLPLIGLAVAIVAVPMLLSSSGEPPVVPEPAPVDLANATAVDAAVTVSNTGIRNYRERLEELKSKNPFDQQYQNTLAPGEDGSSEVTGSDLPPVPGSTAGAPSDGSSGGSTSVPPTDTTIDTTIDTGPPDTVPSDGTEVETSVRFYADRVDVKVGPLGHTKKLRDVRHLDFLPDDRTPIVAFLGLAGGPDHAMFSVNPAVIETGGEGSCAPKGKDGCQYLTLGIGEERYFKYGFGDDAETYRLKLLDTDIVRIPDPRDDGSGDDPEQAGAPE